ncbi:MAG: cytochrome c3 family protein [Anaerolineales bacterium]
MISRLLRLLLGLIIALPLGLAAYAFAGAHTTLTASAAPAATAAPADTDELDCQACHQQFQTAWEGGAHSQALSDPIFQEDWAGQGQPQECLGCHTTGFDPKTGTFQAAGVTCDACHSPVASNHPLAPASMSRSADLCGQCHRDTEAEWRASLHGQSELTCISCHDPHATTIRADDAAALCADCHGTRVAAYAHSNHAKQGLSCTDCHITKTDTPLGMGKGQHSHTFKVDLNTCTQCHENELHNPAAAMLLPAAETTPTPTPEPPSALISGSAGTISSTPEPTNPAGFAIFAGLIGLALGMVLAPWLERGFRRLGQDHAKV